MNMRDKIAAIIKASTKQELSCYAFADAIIAALPGMVSDLVWEACKGQPWRHTAKGVLPENYTITDWQRRDESLDPAGVDGFWLMGLAQIGHLPFDALEAAKAAANAHHRAAVCKAMGVAP